MTRKVQMDKYIDRQIKQKKDKKADRQIGSQVGGVRRTRDYILSIVKKTAFVPSFVRLFKKTLCKMLSR